MLTKDSRVQNIPVLIVGLFSYVPNYCSEMAPVKSSIPVLVERPKLVRGGQPFSRDNKFRGQSFHQTGRSRDKSSNMNETNKQVMIMFNNGSDICAVN